MTRRRRIRILFVEADDIGKFLRIDKSVFERAYFLLKDVRFRMWFKDASEYMGRFDWLFSPPLGLSFISSEIRKVFGEKVETSFYSFTLRNLGLCDKSWIDTLKSYHPDIIAFSHNDYICEDRCAERIRIAKVTVPNAVVVLGGINATFRSGFFFDNTPVDYIILGEGERTAVLLIERLIGNRECSDIKNVANSTHSKTAAFIPEKWPIADIEIDYSGLFHNKYLRVSSFATIQAQRGCNYTCSFCIGRNYWGRGVRCRKAENIIREIKFLINNGAKFIFFVDADFLASDEYADRLLTRIISCRCDSVMFGVQSRIKNLSKDILARMREANVRYIFLGFENADDTALASFGKHRGIVYKDVIAMIKELRAYNIFSEVSFLIDRNYLNDSVFEKNVKAMSDLYDAGVGWVDIRNYLPFPGLKIDRDRFLFADKRNFFFYGYPVCGKTHKENDILRRIYMKFILENMRIILRKCAVHPLFYYTALKAYWQDNKKFGKIMFSEQV